MKKSCEKISDITGNRNDNACWTLIDMVRIKFFGKFFIPHITSFDFYFYEYIRNIC